MRKTALCVLLLSCSFVLAQSNNSNDSSSKGQITIQGCVSRASGDYILIKQNPAMTYELQATGKTKLRRYLGQRVEITGKQEPSMSTSSDSLTRTGSASPVTLVVDSIKTISNECPVRAAGQ